MKNVKKISTTVSIIIVTLGLILTFCALNIEHAFADSRINKVLFFVGNNGANGRKWGRNGRKWGRGSVQK